MTTFRRTIRWLLLIVLVVAAAGGGYAWWLWERSNDIVRQRVLEAFAESVPDWDVTLGRVSFDWSRRIHLYDLKVKARGQSQPVAVLPEVVVTIDGEAFAENREVVVQTIRTVGPVLELVRSPEGQWNWEELLPLPDSDRSCPEWVVEQAEVRIRLEQPGNAGPITLLLRNADLRLIPSGKREYVVEGNTQVNQAGKLAVDGRWHLGARRWSLSGRMNGVAGSGEFSEMVLSSVPELAAKLARLESAIARYEANLPRTENIAASPGSRGSGDPPSFPGPLPPYRSPFLPASAQRTTTAAIDDARTETDRAPESASAASTDAGGTMRRLGVSGTVDIAFRMTQKQPETEPEFKLRVKVRQGRITNSVLPFPLHELEGTIDWDNRQVVVHELTAKNGITRVRVGGKFVRHGAKTPGRFDLAVSNLVLDHRLRNRLPGSLGKVYDSLQPTGTADVEGALYFDGRRAWQPHDFVLTFEDCSGAHVEFPYRFHAIEGTLEQREDDRLVADLTGRAGRSPASMTGYIKNPGPEAEAFFDLHVERLPLDDTFTAACRAEVQKTIDALNLEGDARRVHAQMYRPPGLEQKFQLQLSARLEDGSLEFVGFPLRLTGLSGEIAHSSRDRLWTFENLKARHGTARLSGSASFDRSTEPGLLNLVVETRDAWFDKGLRHALPESLQEMWDELSPSGRLDVTTKIRWVPGEPPVVSLPKAEVSEGGLVLRSLPYPLTDVEGTFRYAGQKVDVLSFQGRHERTAVRAEGLFDWTDEGDWRLRLVEFYADDVVPDRSFRRALPRDLRSIVEELDPEGPISLSGMLEFRGTDDPQLPVTAAWDVETVHSGGRLTAGVDLENVYGKLGMRGTWDGREVNMTGSLDLDSLTVWDYHFTRVRGPLRIGGNQITIGSREILVPNAETRGRRSRSVPPEQRITARAIGGTVSLDGAVVLDREPSYRVILTMAEGSLQQYARQYMPRANNLRGVMTGWIDLQGRGAEEESINGRGRLQISPAALYELPVMVQIVNVVGPPDRTAFRYGFFDFNVAKKQFLFNRIYLAGDALSLAGRGTAGFDGRLDLKFYSMLPPQTQLPIPIVNVLVGEATTGLVGVRVDGTVEQPRAKVTAVPQLDEALTRFLSGLTSGPPGAPYFLIPPLNPPRPRRPAGPSGSGTGMRRFR